MHLRPIQPTDHAEWLRMRHGLKEIASDTQLDNTVSIHAHTGLGYKEVERLVCFRKALDATSALQNAPSDASASTTSQTEAGVHVLQS